MTTQNNETAPRFVGRRQKFNCSRCGRPHETTALLSSDGQLPGYMAEVCDVYDRDILIKEPQLRVAGKIICSHCRTIINNNPPPRSCAFCRSTFGIGTVGEIELAGGVRISMRT